MTLTTTQILALARKKMLEEGTEIIDDINALIYANLTYEDLQMKVFPKRQIQEATLVFTNGVAPLPDNFGTLAADPYQSAYAVFPEVSIANFIRQQLGQMVCVEGDNMKVFPTSTASMIIKYYPIYDALTDSVDPEGDPYFHECIVYGILFRCYEDLQDEELSKYYKDKYDLMIKEKTGVLSNYEEDNQGGNVLFNGVNLISGGGSSNDPNYW